ncbi:hypothetical protein OTU49_014862 [Cherax quadricarinatus]|uniref:Uncharacterized protein n=1 Tax=Cherax quadricarinatus TaxID=27406 RepID=A0AAW0YQY3_CHEQU
MSEESCKCPVNSTESLPTAPRTAAEEGKVQHVRAWLNAGGDINAPTIVSDAAGPGVTLLSTACSHNQVKVVEELLKNPVIHLNTCHITEHGTNCTPLWIAAFYGYDDCVSSLLYSKLKCVIDLSVPAVMHNNENWTAVMAAAAKGHWKIVRMIIDVHLEMICDEADFVIIKAADNNEWDIVLCIIKHKFQLPTETFKHLIQRAYSQEMLDMVCTILQQNFRYKNERVCEVLSKMVKKGCWNKIMELLILVKKEIKFDLPLVKAALAEDFEDVKSIVKKLDEPILDGTRLVVAACGTSDEVAYLLYRSNYTSEEAIYKHCLLIASMNGHLEILTPLFERHFKYFTYSLLSRARQLAMEARTEDTENLLQLALCEKAKNLCS